MRVLWDSIQDYTSVCETERASFGNLVARGTAPEGCVAPQRAETPCTASDPARALSMRGPAPPPRQARAAAAALPLLLLTALALAALAPAAAQLAPWLVITDLQAAKAAGGVEVSIVGPPQQPFSRPPPRTLDSHLLADFAAQLNQLQDVSSQGDNAFTDTAEQVSGLGFVWCGVVPSAT